MSRSARLTEWCWWITSAVLICLLFLAGGVAGEVTIKADLLVVGGTESGCAAAVQAARMGVEKTVLVNDIDWLGGQFSAEGLGAIDENRAHGYDGSVPIPRSGIFLEVIDAIEAENAERYGGVRRPGNTRVITTSRPVISEQVFRELLAPYERTRQVQRFSNYLVESVLKDGRQVTGVRFRSRDQQEVLTVQAGITIDASDWGDVIQASGAKWDAGIDSKSEFAEPSAPDSPESSTDMNPITWCMILQRQSEKTLFAEPTGYDPRYFNGKWGWIDEEFAYTSRRLVDGMGLAKTDCPDVLLINSPPIDYPLDVFPAEVAARLEATEKGASRKNLVAMTPQQRDIVFADARQHTLKYYYHLQKRFPKFQFMALSDEFGTKDRLPPKPYIRESLRLVAQHIVSEQEVLGFGSRSNYAHAMFPDAVFCWQFEMDFHPTKRSWTTDKNADGPWEADFHGNRRFGRGGTGRCVFPLRAFVPRQVGGLLGAQKNLGYTSIVSSSCRLHDQSIHAGQASGAVAAVSLRRGIEPSKMAMNRTALAEVWQGLLQPEGGRGMVIWPFADVDPSEPAFVAIQQLALRRILPMDASDTEFLPDQPASAEWIGQLVTRIREAGYDPPHIVVTTRTEKRRNIANIAWKHLKNQPLPEPARRSATDADGDGVPDDADALPFTPGVVSWKIRPDQDGMPALSPPFPRGAKAFNFTSAQGPPTDGFINDHGQPHTVERGFGWSGNLTANTRLRRSHSNPLVDGFVFTRKQDVWHCDVDNGQWTVHVCLGDAAHDQPGQHLRIESHQLKGPFDTVSGQFRELTAQVNVKDSRLTLTLGEPQGGSNTCINWVILIPGEGRIP